MRFMATSLTKLVDNISEGIHKIKCKEYVCSLKYERVRNNLIKYKCLSCNKNYLEKLNEELESKFKNTFAFSNNDVNKFILLLRKSVCSYDYMNDWERFNETALPEKEKFYSNLNMADITDADYAHAKRVYKNFEIKNSGEYHDLYLRSFVLLLSDVFENLRKMCLEIYELHSAKFILAPGLTWQAALKKTQVELDLITDIDMLLMIEKGIRDGTCNAVHRSVKATDKYMDDNDENKELPYPRYWDVNNLYGWAMSQKLPTYSFEWVEDISEFYEVFIKNYD